MCDKLHSTFGNRGAGDSTESTGQHDCSENPNHEVFYTPACSQSQNITPKSSITTSMTHKASMLTPVTIKSPADSTMFKSPIGTPLYRSSSFSKSTDTSPALHGVSPLTSKSDGESPAASPRVILKFANIRDHGLQRPSVATSFSEPESPSDVTLRNISKTLLRKRDIRPGAGTIRKMEFTEGEASPKIAGFVLEKTHKKRPSESEDSAERTTTQKRRKSLSFSGADENDPKVDEEYHPNENAEEVFKEENQEANNNNENEPNRMDLSKSEINNNEQENVVEESVTTAAVPSPSEGKLQTRRRLELGDSSESQQPNVEMDQEPQENQYPPVYTLSLSDLERMSSPYNLGTSLNNYSPTDLLWYPPNVSIPSVPRSTLSPDPLQMKTPLRHEHHGPYHTYSHVRDCLDSPDRNLFQLNSNDNNKQLPDSTLHTPVPFDMSNSTPQLRTSDLWNGCIGTSNPGNNEANRNIAISRDGITVGNDRTSVSNQSYSYQNQSSVGQQAIHPQNLCQPTPVEMSNHFVSDQQPHTIQYLPQQTLDRSHNPFLGQNTQHSRMWTGQLPSRQPGYDLAHSLYGSSPHSYFPNPYIGSNIGHAGSNIGHAGSNIGHAGSNVGHPYYRTLHNHQYNFPSNQRAADHGRNQLHSALYHHGSGLHNSSTQMFNNTGYTYGNSAHSYPLCNNPLSWQFGTGSSNSYFNQNRSNTPLGYKNIPCETPLQSILLQTRRNAETARQQQQLANTIPSTQNYFTGSQDSGINQSSHQVNTPNQGSSNSVSVVYMNQGDSSQGQQMALLFSADQGNSASRNHPPQTPLQTNDAYENQMKIALEENSHSQNYCKEPPTDLTHQQINEPPDLPMEDPITPSHSSWKNHSENPSQCSKEQNHILNPTSFSQEANAQQREIVLHRDHSNETVESVTPKQTVINVLQPNESSKIDKPAATCRTRESGYHSYSSPLETAEENEASLSHSFHSFDDDDFDEDEDEESDESTAFETLSSEEDNVFQPISPALSAASSNLLSLVTPKPQSCAEKPKTKREEHPRKQPMHLDEGIIQSKAAGRKKPTPSIEAILKPREKSSVTDALSHESSVEIISIDDPHCSATNQKKEKDVIIELSDSEGTKIVANINRSSTTLPTILPNTATITYGLAPNQTVYPLVFNTNQSNLSSSNNQISLAQLYPMLSMNNQTLLTPVLPQSTSVPQLTHTPQSCGSSASIQGIPTPQLPRILPTSQAHNNSTVTSSRAARARALSGDHEKSSLVSSTTQGYQGDSVPKSRFFSLVGLEIGSFQMTEPDPKKRLARVQFQFNIGKITYEIPYSFVPNISNPKDDIHITLVDIPFAIIVGINAQKNDLIIEVKSTPTVKGKEHFGRNSKNPSPLTTSGSQHDPTGGQLKFCPYHKLILRPDVPKRITDLMCATDPRFIRLSKAPLEMDHSKQIRATGDNTTLPSMTLEEQSVHHYDKPHKSTTCNCSTGCLVSRCKCATAFRQCTSKCKCNHALHNCLNPVNVLTKSGINVDVAKKDPCLVANIFRIKALQIYLESPVMFPCCAISRQTGQCLPGEVRCPVAECTHKYTYSWCHMRLMDNETEPRHHCEICCRCTDVDSVHCDSCNECFQPSEEVPECPCMHKRFLDSEKHRIQQQIRNQKLDQVKGQHKAGKVRGQKSRTPSETCRAPCQNPSDVEKSSDPVNLYCNKAKEPVCVVGNNMAMVTRGVVMDLVDIAMETETENPANSTLNTPRTKFVDSSETESETELKNDHASLKMSYQEVHPETYIDTSQIKPYDQMEVVCGQSTITTPKTRRVDDAMFVMLPSADSPFGQQQNRDNIVRLEKSFTTSLNFFSTFSPSSFIMSSPEGPSMVPMIPLEHSPYAQNLLATQVMECENPLQAGNSASQDELETPNVAANINVYSANNTRDTAMLQIQDKIKMEIVDQARAQQEVLKVVDNHAQRPTWPLPEGIRTEFVLGEPLKASSPLSQN